MLTQPRHWLASLHTAV